MKSYILFAILFFISIYTNSQTIVVNDIKEFNTAISGAVPGTKIVLKNGVWNNVELNVYGIGKKENPIVITAETPGKVLITGDSNMNISGKHIIVNGLWFKDGNPTLKSIISFRKNTKEAAYDCRLTNSTISYYNPTDQNLNTHWIDLWGKNNRVDHNNFTGKTNAGTTLVVWLKGDEHINNNHRIDHNYFGERPELGVNGGETIRIGTSENSMKSSNTIVESNTFQNCDGEIEIISNKSGNNIFRNNLFVASKGMLTLRHGDNALVESNVFLGNNTSNTGGIRIINEGHIVRNNLLVGLNGTGMRGSIVIMNGVPNSPLNRYNQVKNVDIINNTLINSSPMEFAYGKDNERTLPPINTVFANNLITNTNSGVIYNSSDTIDGITFKNNIVNSDANIDSERFTKVLINWTLLKSLPMPDSTNTSLISLFKNKNTPTVDITNTPKSKNIIGAFNLNNKLLPSALTMRTGTYWKAAITKPTPKIVSKTILVKPGVNTLKDAFKEVSNKTVLVLEDGIYYMSSSQKVNGNITIKGTTNTIIKGSDDLPNPLNYFFRINPKSTLSVENIIFDGESDTMVKYAIVSPDENQAEKYNLYIDNCTFKNFNNKSGGSIFKAYVGTLADTISVKNSSFLDSYRGLNLSYEKSALEKYNAEIIIIQNSLFKNIEEFAINYFKSGLTNDSALGKLFISNSIFSNVANSESGKIIKTNRIPLVEIKNSIFEKSYLIKNPISLSGIHNKITNSLIYTSGQIKTSNGAIESDIYYKNPKWEDNSKFIPSKKSILLKENNKIDLIGFIN